MIERRIKAAKFPTTKSLDSFDFKVIASLNKPLVTLNPAFSIIRLAARSCFCIGRLPLDT